jgi:hypothetical protein
MAPLGEEKSARTSAGAVSMETHPNHATLQKDYISARHSWYLGSNFHTGSRTGLTLPHPGELKTLLRATAPPIPELPHKLQGGKA